MIALLKMFNFGFQSSVTILGLSLFAAYACKPAAPADHPASPASPSPHQNTIQVPETTCYESNNTKDVFRLKVEKFPNVVTGRLTYKFAQKDATEGTFEGTMHGDTLIADYTFEAEGSTSIRQIAFLLTGKTAVEGYGDMIDQNGKMVFKHITSLNFEKGVAMSLTDCAEHTLVAQEKALTGIWDLTYISGPKIAFDGLYPNKKPYIEWVDNSQMRGFTSCNNFSGNYSADGKTIHFDRNIALSNRACEGNGEDVFIDMLVKVNNFDFEASALVFRINGTTVMRFARR